MQTLKISLLVFILSINSFAQNCGWFWQNPLPQGNPLTDVSFVNDKVGYAIGQCGTILKTSDSGNSWIILNSTIESTLLSISFAIPPIIIGR